MTPDISEIKYSLMKGLDIDFMEGAAAAVGVRSEEDAKHALEMALQARKLEQTLEKSRIEITKPHVDFQKAVNKLVKDFNAKLQMMQESLQCKIDVWMSENKDDPFVCIDKIKTDEGSLYTTEEWDFEIKDASIVPNEFLKPDENKIREAVKNGFRNIPGVYIMKRTKTIMRVKN